MKKISELKFKETVELIKKGEISCSEVMRSTLDRIEEYDGELGSYISIFDRDYLMKKADESDKRYKSGVILSEIDGIPISLKDNMHVLGLNTTCGSNMLRNYSPCFNATVTEKILKSGGILSVKLTATNSLWDRLPRPPFLKTLKILGISIKSPADRPAVLRLASRRGCANCPSVATQAVL